MTEAAAAEEAVKNGDQIANSTRRCAPTRQNRPLFEVSFILTTVLGIVGALVATYLGQAIGWYHAGEGAGLVGAVVGALIVLVIWGFLARRDTRAV